MKADILSNKELKPGYFLIELNSPDIARSSLPGQFIMIRIGDSYDPLLRRPMSIHNVSAKRGVIEVLYQAAGKGTRILSEKKKKESIDILGPLGNSFFIYKDIKAYLLAAGGIGIAPFGFLIKSIKKINKDASILLFIGGKSEADILENVEFKKSECDIYISTEDGSAGEKGVVTELLNRYLERNNNNSALYVCGPQGMMKEAASIAKRYNLKCQVSLDERMACGIGICMGCVVSIIDDNTKETAYKCICREGPVFNANKVMWR